LGLEVAAALAPGVPLLPLPCRLQREQPVGGNPTLRGGADGGGEYDERGHPADGRADWVEEGECEGEVVRAMVALWCLRRML